MDTPDALPSWEEKALTALDTGEIDQAFNALVEGCGQVILAYCIARIGDKEIASDVAQEVFAAAWEALPDYRRQASLRTWLFAIAHHRCANRRRMLGRVRRIFSHAIDQTVEEAQPDPSDLPEEAVIKHQQAEQLRRALGKLRKKERDLIIMYHMEELSLEKIAERYSVSRGIVSKQLFEAWQKLKRMMNC